MARLCDLAGDGKLAEVRLALARGEDVNSKNSVGTTALMRAVGNKHNSIVKLVLDQPAVGVNVKDIIGGTESQNFGVDPMTLPFLRFFLICYTPILRRIFFFFF